MKKLTFRNCALGLAACAAIVLGLPVVKHQEPLPVMAGGPVKSNSKAASHSEAASSLSPQTVPGVFARALGLKRSCPKVNPALNTDSLKQSDWFSRVTAEIKKHIYYVASEPDGGAVSINPAHRLQAKYSASVFSLSPLKQVDNLEPKLPGLKKAHLHPKQSAPEWSMQLRLKGLFADGRMVAAPGEEQPAIVKEGEAQFVAAPGLKVQYQNNEAGVRQNFIVEQAPDGDVRELRVGLELSKGWKASKTSDRELLFTQCAAKGKGQESSITYNDLKVWDADGKILPAHMGANGREVVIVVASKGAKYPVTIDPLSATSPKPVPSPGVLYDNFGFSVASAGDVNGDGYSDVVVGANGISSYRGAAYVYYGTSTGLSNSPAATLTRSGGVPYDYFGSCVASAGDVNGDGYSDIVVGAHGVSSNTGAAYVYHGSSAGLSSTPAATLTLGGGVSGDLFGNCVASAGDMNGDGYSDVVVGAPEASSGAGGAYVYMGSSSGLSTALVVTTLTRSGTAAGDYFGRSVASAGDVNGDGYSDLAIGAWGVSSGTGAVYIYHGGATWGARTGFSIRLYGPAITLSGVSANDRFGGCVASAGDVNCDGYSDVVVGANGVSSFRGATYIYTGSSTGLSATRVTAITISGGLVDDRFGYCVASAGDVNGDGYSDVVVGARGVSNYSGAAYVYLGSSTGLATTPSNTLTRSAISGTQFGCSVAPAGDVDGDGYSDLVVGAYGSLTNNPGAAFIYYGGAANGPMSSTAAGTNPLGDAYAGFSVASAGDVNGDGYSDVVVGAYGNYNQPGAAFVYHGSMTGLSSSPAIALSGTSTGAMFGYSVASAGDLNGDGYSDLVVGAPGVSGNTGAVCIYYGSPTGLSPSPSTLNGTTLHGAFGSSVASAGDVNGDGYFDLIIGAPGDVFYAGNGTAYIYTGSSSGLSYFTSFSGTAQFDRFGTCVASAGDLNRDGYSDVVVSAATPNQTGKAVVYYGSSGGFSSSITLVRNSPVPSDQFGSSVASAGDVNGDGYSDLIVGAPGVAGSPASSSISNYMGAAYIYYGSSGGINANPNQTLYRSGRAPNDYFGFSVAPAGDVNGDGYADVVVGSYAMGTSRGGIFVYLGAATGLSTNAASGFPSAVGGGFGWCVAPAGDVNGDGAFDILVGVNPAYRPGVTPVLGGLAVVFPGTGNAAPRSSLMRLYETNLSTPISQSNLSASQFGVGLFVKPFLGASRARLVWEVEKNGTGFLGSNTITNYGGFGGASGWTTIPRAGVELKSLVGKASGGKSAKLRVRVEYQSGGLPGGLVFGPWVYPQAYLSGSRANAATPLYAGLTLPKVYAAGDGNLGNENSGISSWQVAMENSVQDNAIKLSPVPAVGAVQVTNTDEKLNGSVAEVIDINGRLITRFTLQASQELDIHGWASGTYYLKLANGSTCRIVKQ